MKRAQRHFFKVTCVLAVTLLLAIAMLGIWKAQISKRNCDQEVLAAYQKIYAAAMDGEPAKLEAIVDPEARERGLYSSVVKEFRFLEDCANSGKPKINCNGREAEVTVEFLGGKSAYTLSFRKVDGKWLYSGKVFTVGFSHFDAGKAGHRKFDNRPLCFVPFVCFVQPQS